MIELVLAATLSRYLGLDAYLPRWTVSIIFRAEAAALRAAAVATPAALAALGTLLTAAILAALFAIPIYLVATFFAAIHA